MSQGMWPEYNVIGMLQILPVSIMYMILLLLLLLLPPLILLLLRRTMMMMMVMVMMIDHYFLFNQQLRFCCPCIEVLIASFSIVKGSRNPMVLFTLSDYVHYCFFIADLVKRHTAFSATGFRVPLYLYQLLLRQVHISASRLFLPDRQHILPSSLLSGA